MRRREGRAEVRQKEKYASGGKRRRKEGRSEN